MLYQSCYRNCWLLQNTLFLSKTRKSSLDSLSCLFFIKAHENKSEFQKKKVSAALCFACNKVRSIVLIHSGQVITGCIWKRGENKYNTKEF